MPWYDSTYILVLIGAGLSLLASSHVKSTFAKFSRVRSFSGMTGAQAAARLLSSQGIHDVRIEQVAGELTDHYDPRSRVLRLSTSVYGSTSIAAIGVAAHECGHALQHDCGYAPLTIRGMLVPVANFGASISWPLVLLGLILFNGQTGELLIQIGILLFCAVVLFQIVTLPVEFNASRRALMLLESSGILGSEELPGTRKVLSAAAMTYVAGVAASLLQLLRLVMLANRRRD